MLVYATAQDYADYTGQDAPDGIEQALARASERIDELLMGAVYAVDAAEMPTDTKVRQAVRQATCAQAAWSIAVGDPYGVASAFKSVSIGSVKLDRASGGAGDGPPRYAQDALSILRTAGLLPGIVIDGPRW
ncbi:hypothetical protein ACIBG7_12710 [Nonomuraea sp. NPDC050328]|uniref:hypothetical protein n=1 Tax=Nonomuraea sp. NPDC050328 TaxID=3364361 RepID=UPI0037B34F8F